ncbi:MAG: glutamate formimidoyltransferase [Bacteroidia bacterium]|nr:glutamate formimidoyltransferase [Bacteroidia bacterium]MDW8089134.1 glutamate formimidoyltransferase [Bacteroidia bacterium]
MEPVLLCTPNFSEGQNPEFAKALVEHLGGVKGVKILTVDQGASVNRTVLAFGGEPEAVFEAARRGYELAAKHIDMRQHKGLHPRIGAVDVCPFTPYRGIEKNWLGERVRQFAQVIADVFRLPVYLYAESAQFPERRWLPNLRKGGYEKLAERLKDPQWAPDFGPVVFNPRLGATAIGLRDFIAALNFTLNTKSEALARKIARQVRASGGGLPHVQALGWFLPEVGFAQVSVNIVNLREMPIHQVFERIDELARGLGVRVTEVEVIGLLPEWALLEAASYFLQKAGEKSEGMSKEELLKLAVHSLMLKDFRPEERLPEWVFGAAEAKWDVGELSVRELVWQLAERHGGLSEAVAVGVQAALGLSLAARLAAGLPARHAFTHGEFVQLLQDVLLALQQPNLALDALRTLSKKVLRGFALLRQISETLSADQKEHLLLLSNLLHGTVETIGAALFAYQSQWPELAQERHDIELQGRFFREEILQKLRL